MNVPLSAVEQSGETSEVVRLPPSLGGGYLAWAEVSHQLHCVNMLRKAIYAEYYRNRTRDLQQDRHLVYKHLVDHCVDLLRQVLLCNADTGIQLHHWVKRNPTPVPNGNTWHKCKDTESILAWTRDRQVIFPPGERSIPILPGSSVYEGNP
ncbi:hypothetical protein ASPZODRAFT_58964 [Penicilliopsis zonata CBS 506.65]|uniref:Uncharacterized protein n=1 Tax=Penicilliopsis zonata CBS 506.65 TaxID=1073090 RepID=A0A1L9SS93_9EURO|nr:hypothetical protein ASPZODRAFT_58964 [Penicilliopsis zonata CBS 506.65]OJJ50082.1 hypothetical protein ASPZODRAFT_58964 [Penicilliopsis zonata CBS 506.65]